MICKKCGKENNHGEKYCGNCGEILEDVNNFETTNKPNNVKKNKKGKKVIIILLVILLIAIIISIFLVRENMVTNKKENTIENKETEKNDKQDKNKQDTEVEKDLDVNSSIVDYLRDNFVYSAATIEVVSSLNETTKENTINAVDLSSDTKFRMAVQMANTKGDTSFSNCNDSNGKARKDLGIPDEYLENVGCGSNYYNSTTDSFKNSNESHASTTLYKESVIKKYMNTIFGKDVYKRADSYYYGSYHYVAAEEGYVYLEQPIGGGSGSVMSEIISAKEIGSKIILQGKWTDSGLEHTFTYTFIKDNEQAYHLDSISVKETNI